MDQDNQKTAMDLVWTKGPEGYPWPRPWLIFSGSRNQGRTNEARELQMVRRIVNDNRRAFWEARLHNVYVQRAIEIAQMKQLEEVDALLLAVGQLLEENRRLMEHAQAPMPPQSQEYICPWPGCGTKCTSLHDYHRHNERAHGETQGKKQA